MSLNISTEKPTVTNDGRSTSLRRLEDEVEAKNRSFNILPSSHPGAVSLNESDSKYLRKDAKFRASGPGLTLNDPLAPNNSRRAAGVCEQLDTLDARISAKLGMKSDSIRSSHKRLENLDARITAKQRENASVSLKGKHFSEQNKVVIRTVDNAQDNKNGKETFGGENKLNVAQKQDEFSPEEVTPISVAAHGIVSDPGLMSGTMSGALTDENLAVAIAVSPDEERFIIPSAIEYEPDSKPPLYKNRRFRFYIIAGSILLFAIGVATALAVVIAKESASYSVQEVPTSLRDRLAGDSLRKQGIWKEIVKEIGESSFALEDSAGALALDWIMNEDPLALSADSENLIQRYICALFYLATTAQKPWVSCNRPMEGQDANCTHKKLIEIEPELIYEEEPNKFRWLSEKHECFWNGISCDSFYQIRALELRGQEIRGPLPTEIAKIPNLQSLSIMWNELYGTLPSEIANMKHLLNIEVHFNFFTGQVPIEWYKARALQRINFAGNFLTGTIPTEIGLLRTLKGFFNFENNIIGTIPTEIGLMKFLSYTRWGRNSLTGTIPSEVGSLTKLQELWIHRNQLTGELPSEIGLLKDITDFRVHYNLLSGIIPEESYNMSQLRRWDLYNCNFTSPISTKIGQLQDLTMYRIRGNNFYGTIPTEIGKLKQLDLLWFYNNQLEGEVPREVCALRSNARGIAVLAADCGPTDHIGDPRIDCMSDCCTICCDPVADMCFKE